MLHNLKLKYMEKYLINNREYTVLDCGIFEDQFGGSVHQIIDGKIIRPQIGATIWLSRLNWADAKKVLSIIKNIIRGS